jgi:catechol 2,3-dioxygenase-like lactoylglutathione lyase family enzyme
MTLKALVPMAFVTNLPRSMAFYSKLGFRVANTHTPAGSGEPVWAWLESDGAQLMLSRASEPLDPGARTVLFYLYSTEVAEYREWLLAAGVEAGPMEYPFWSPEGEFHLTDPDGHVLLVSHT